MDSDTPPPPIPPRPPGWVSSPLPSPRSGPVLSSPQPQSVNNETPPPLPPRRPSNEEQQPPFLERQSRPYSYVPPSRESSGLSPPPLPPRVTRRPVSQREPQPQPQPQPQSSSPQFKQFRPQQFQAPKYECSPPSPFQSQAGNQTTSAEFGGFRGQYTPYQPQQTFPPPPPPPPPPPSSSSSLQPIPYEKWTPLFQPTGAPNPIFIALMKSFFEMLVAQQTPEMRPADINGNGNENGMMAPAVNGQKLLLSPEKCSEFLDVQGFAVEHNLWKLNKTPWSTTLPGLPDPFAAVTPLDKADWEFRLILQAFGIHHLPIPRPRPRPASPNPSHRSSVSTNPLIPSWLTSILTTSSTEIPESMRVLGIGQTPFLTEQGFIKYMALETAGEPDRGFEGVNAALRYYSSFAAGQNEEGGGQWGGPGGGGSGEGGIKRWMEKLGPIPRDMFPGRCPKEIQTAVDVGQAKHRRLCEEAVAGSRAYCEMAAEGRRHAVELTGNYRTVRVDEWGNRIW